MNLDKDFVTFEVAEKIKLLGFDEECIAYWIGEDRFFFLSEKGAVNLTHVTTRPLWSQVFEWFQTKYDFKSEFYKINEHNPWTWKLIDPSKGYEVKIQNTGETETEYEARIKWIDRAIFKINNPNTVEETWREQSMRLLHKHLESPESDEYFNNLKKDQDIKEQRFQRLEEYLKTHDFDVFLQKIIKDNGDEWRIKCYKKGFQPYPTNLMQLLYDYVEKHGIAQELGSVDDNAFESSLYLFKGYYFQLFCGQGCVIRVFNSNKEIILTI